MIQVALYCWRQGENEKYSGSKHPPPQQKHATYIMLILDRNHENGLSPVEVNKWHNLNRGMAGFLLRNILCAPLGVMRSLHDSQPCMHTQLNTQNTKKHNFSS